MGTLPQFGLLKYHKNALLWSRGGYGALDGATRLFPFKAVLAGRRDANVEACSLALQRRTSRSGRNLRGASGASLRTSPPDLDTNASRSSCSLLFPTNPLFIYKGKHLRADGRGDALKSCSPVGSSCAYRRGFRVSTRVRAVGSVGICQWPERLGCRAYEPLDRKGVPRAGFRP